MNNLVTSLPGRFISTTSEIYIFFILLFILLHFHLPHHLGHPSLFSSSPMLLMSYIPVSLHSALEDVLPDSCTRVLFDLSSCPLDHLDYYIGLPYYLGNVVTGAQSFYNEHSQVSFRVSMLWSPKLCTCTVLVSVANNVGTFS